MHPARRNKKKRNNKNNNNNNDINKSLDVILPKNRRMRKRPAATNAIYATRKWTEGLKPYELRFPTNMEVPKICWLKASVSPRQSVHPALMCGLGRWMIDTARAASRRALKSL